MAEAGDILQEWKQAKPPEKAVIVLGIIAVIAVAWYLHMKSQASQPATQQGTSTGAAGGQVAGFPMAGSTPVLPSGTNPVYDPNGNLVAFQNANPIVAPGTVPTGPMPPIPSPQGANWYTNFVGKLGYNSFIRVGGTDTNGQRFWIGKTGNSSMFYAPSGSTIQYGPQGRVWLSPGGDQSQHVLLTGPGMNQSSTSVAKVASK